MRKHRSFWEKLKVGSCSVTIGIHFPFPAAATNFVIFTVLFWGAPLIELSPFHLAVKCHDPAFSPFAFRLLRSFTKAHCIEVGLYHYPA